MHWFRVTKYNPIFRDKLGHYTKDEWTAYSDVGKTFNTTVVTFNEYISVEDSYVYAVTAFMSCLGISDLIVVDLEKHFDDFDEHYSPQMIDTLATVKNNQHVTAATIEDIIRLVLRENIWCKLEGEGLCIHFGYDYYMFIGSETQCPEQIEAILKKGLFVEPFVSPFL